MLMLETRWGNYCLNNALKLDFYQVKEKDLWSVYFTIDSYKHLLQSFDDVTDSIKFCDHVRSELLEALGNGKSKRLIMYDICERAISKVIGIDK